MLSCGRSFAFASLMCWNILKMIAFDAPMHFCIAAPTAEVLWPEVITGRLRRMIDSYFETMSRSLWETFVLAADFWGIECLSPSSSRADRSTKSWTLFHHLDIFAAIRATSSGSEILWLIDLCRSSRMNPFIRLWRARNAGRRKRQRSIKIFYEKWLTSVRMRKVR